MAAPPGDHDHMAIAIIGAVVVAALLLFAAVAAYRAYNRAHHPAAVAAAAFPVTTAGPLGWAQPGPGRA